MKKNLVRFVALMLVALLALTLVPLGALAAGVSVDVVQGSFSEEKPTPNDLIGNADYLKTETGNKSVTIKTSNYDKYIVHPDGEDYDLKGVIDPTKVKPSEMDKKLNPKSDITFKEYGVAMLIYVPHAHKLSRWVSDGTTHWRNCLVCKDKFFYQNWCQDGDGDKLCNVCGGEVPYHNVTVVDDPGGVIVVNEETAAHRTKITADVTANTGYRLKALHFIKVRDDGSRQEVVRYQDNGQYWTYMPTYDLEVTAEFVKD